MRYSILVYLLRMSHTLLEAAQYLRTWPEEKLRRELLENGRQMLVQMRALLESNRGSLRTEQPLSDLDDIAVLWATGGKGLEAALSRFAEELPKEVSYRVRAVFFAELGEKWDAMASVYEAMRADPRFDPVVVLTPIFRQVQQSDGTVKQETIYRDYLTELGLPFYGYDEYDIEKDCPELAFTSQPYESCTLPPFWAENIAKHTRLVYLPYYLPDMVTENSVLTLAQLPVYRFAWKAACATEKQRKFYCRHAANGGANALMTGIPKTDAFVHMAAHPAPLPEAWARLRGKTVFLWNTWYDYGASSMRYFDRLMDWFAAHPDCGLIWRPHPMTDTVTKLYTPQQYPAYLEMLERVRGSENAVLDEETSCAAAFSVSAAMISDYSSLLPQYLMIDKPALWIQSGHFHFTGEKFIADDWMEQADQIDGVLAFLERICAGEDRNAALRAEIRQRDLPLADGHCGERVRDALWETLHREEQETGGQ